MKTLRDYISEAEQWIDTPRAGDEIDFELAPDSLLETYVIEVREDGVVIEADDAALSLLEQHGALLETIRTYGAVGRAGTGQTYAEQEEIEERHCEGSLKHEDSVGETNSFMSRMLELAGVADHEFNRDDAVYREDQSTSVVAAKELATDIANPMPGVHEEAKEVEEGAMKQRMHADAERLSLEDFVKMYGNEDWVHEFWHNINDPIDEAEYQGREVPLNKPMAGDVKKSKVYVRDPKTGNVKKVNFGDKTMRIKKSNPDRRRSFRARHHCDNPGPKTKARYWSCRAW